MTDSEARHLPLVLFADDGNPPADVAWAWLISHAWPGWQLEMATIHESPYPGGPPTGSAPFVPRAPPAESAFASADHRAIEGGDPRVFLVGQEGFEFLNGWHCGCTMLARYNQGRRSAGAPERRLKAASAGQ